MKNERKMLHQKNVLGVEEHSTSEHSLETRHILSADNVSINGYINRNKTISSRELKEMFAENLEDLKTKELSLELEIYVKTQYVNEIKSKVKNDHEFWEKVFDALFVSRTNNKRCKSIEARVKELKRIRRFINILKGSQSGQITDEVIERARHDVPITDILEDYTEVVRITGDKSYAICPFHKDDKGRSERTASFVCYEESNKYVCYGCNEKGDVIDLVMKLNKYTFIEAVKHITTYEDPK